MHEAEKAQPGFVARSLCLLHSRLKFVSDEGIQNISRHEFHGGQYTWLDLALNPYWTWCQSFVPRSISPNLISVLGELCAAAGTAAAIFGDATSTTPLLLNACLYFVYQTADAVDGKHARITKQSTPLGAVVDHCLDATHIFFVPLSLQMAVDPQFVSWIPTMAFLAYATGWFVAQWQDYECGILETAGVTEAQFLLIGLYAAPTFFGRDMYDSAVLGTSLDLRTTIGIVFLVAVTAKILFTVAQVLHQTRRPSVLMTLLPIAVHAFISIMFYGSASAKSAPIISIAVMFMSATALCSKIVLAVVTSTPLPIVNVEVVPFIGCGAWAALGAPLPRWVLFVVLCGQVFAWCIMAHSFISRSCAVLGVPFLAEVPKCNA